MIITNNKQYRSWEAFRNRGQLCNHWHRSFEAFCHDIGERPKGMLICRKDYSKPLGPKNWEWRKHWNTASESGAPVVRRRKKWGESKYVEVS